LALYKILQDPEFEINCLLTTVSQEFARFDAWRPSGVVTPTSKKYWATTRDNGNPEIPTMEVYEAVMNKTLGKLKQQGVTHSISGIFLEDLRKYREDKLAEIDFLAFPLWKVPTKDLMQNS
jgi:hypothetical protein